MTGYHITDIPRGEYGEASKVREELLEFEDAVYQGNNLMALLELSDLIGAIKGYAEKHGSSLEDLLRMQEATERAFNDGTRKTRGNDDPRPFTYNPEEWVTNICGDPVYRRTPRGKTPVRTPVSEPDDRRRE